jgi:hypothetical protein
LPAVRLTCISMLPSFSILDPLNPSLPLVRASHPTKRYGDVNKLDGQTALLMDDNWVSHTIRKLPNRLPKCIPFPRFGTGPSQAG